MRLDGGDRVVAGQPFAGSVEGGTALRVVLVREAIHDQHERHEQELAQAPVVQGRFEMLAPQTPSYEGTTLRYRYLLRVDEGAAPVRHPIVVVPEEAGLTLDLRGAPAPPAPAGWTATIGTALGLVLGGGCGLLYGLSFGVKLTAALGVLGAAAATGLAGWLVVSRHRTDKRGWSGPFDGLAPEPSYNLPLLRSERAVERLETMFHLRPRPAARDYRGPSPHALEVFLEHSPRCQDILAARLELEVTETRAVRSQTAGPDPKTFWDEHRHPLFASSTPLTPGDEPQLLRGQLEIPKGLPPASWINHWGGIQWRYRFAAETPHGPMHTRWKELRVRSCSPAPPYT